MRALLIISSFLFLVSCASNIEKQNDNAIQTTPNNKQNGIAKIEFKNTMHDFGKIVRGEKVSYSFQFKNTGNADLIIESVKASCGCTVIQYEKKPIAPNQESTIDIIFDSDGFRGTQVKTITVTANSEPSTIELSFGAVVEIPDEK